MTSLTGLFYRAVRASLRTIQIAMVASVLSACASLSGESTSRAITDSSRALGPAVEAFSISGRLVLKQGQRRDHLRFTWDHTTSSDELLLSGPLGQGVARLTRNTDDKLAQAPARLELADGKAYTGADWQSLAQQVFAQAVPLDALPDWLRGANATWSGEQDQWRIVVTEARARNQSASRHHQLAPRAMQISKDDVVMNIVIESWGDEDE